MPDTFRLVANDPLIQQIYPTGTITLAQNSQTFVFEFHGGHTTGNPIYVRVVGNKDSSNVPKFDTKNKSAASYSAYSSLANSGKLDQAKKDKDLKQIDLDEIGNLIRRNWEFLQEFARLYYET